MTYHYGQMFTIKRTVLLLFSKQHVGVVMVSSPLYRVDAHSHGQGLGQWVFTAETQMNASLAAD